MLPLLEREEWSDLGATAAALDQKVASGVRSSEVAARDPQGVEVKCMQHRRCAFCLIPQEQFEERCAE